MLTPEIPKTVTMPERPNPRDSVSRNRYQILCCDWLPDRTRWRYLARSGLSPGRKTCSLSHIMISPLLMRLVQLRDLFMDLDSILVFKQAKRIILPSSHLDRKCFVSNPFIIILLTFKMYQWTCRKSEHF